MCHVLAITLVAKSWSRGETVHNLLAAPVRGRLLRVPIECARGRHQDAHRLGQWVSRNRSRTAAPAPPEPSRVELALGNHSVVVEAAAPLDDVMAAAVKLWNDTGAARDPRPSGEAIGFGLSLADRAEPYVTVDEIPVPHQLIPREGDDL